MSMFFLSKPWTTTGASGMRSVLRMSSWTSGVAVAVRAMVVVSECLSNCSKTVVGAKVVTPLREAVGFVDGQKAQAAGLEKVHKAIGESLRRDIDQFPMTVSKPDEAIASLHRRDGGIDAGCSNSNFLKGIHLVFHQCNQRRDHQTTAFRGHSRKLVAERFASACWQTTSVSCPPKTCSTTAS